MIPRNTPYEDSFKKNKLNKAKKEIHPCSYCDKFFDNVGRLIAHEEQHELNDDPFEQESESDDDVVTNENIAEDTTVEKEQPIKKEQSPYAPIKSVSKIPYANERPGVLREVKIDAKRNGDILPKPGSEEDQEGTD